VRTVAELGGTALQCARSQGGQDIVYLLSSLSYRYLAAGRARDAQVAALEGYGWQAAQAGRVGATPRAAGDALETLASLALDVFEASDALGEADTAIEALMDAMLLEAAASAYAPVRSARRLDELVREAWRVVG
jgi:hypothetical protein